jgi:hypothetical protein
MAQDYTEWIEKEIKSSEGLQKIVERIKTVKDQKCLVISHDDPDGITACLILKRLLDKLGAEVDYSFPPSYILTKEQLAFIVKKKRYDLLFILDKGTTSYYDEHTMITKDIIVIDHHFPDLPEGPPKKCLLYNPNGDPQVKDYIRCSTSLLIHMIATNLGLREDYDDFLCFIGLKGDFAIDPAIGEVSKFAQVFYETHSPKFKNLLTPLKSRPTMFDITQREKTCLLSRITELIHGTCGGGFQYFYNDRAKSLKGVDQVDLVFTSLFKYGRKNPNISNLKRLDHFLNEIPYRWVIQQLYKYYLKDWDNATHLLDSTTSLGKMGRVAIHLFIGEEVPLLPMVGSAKLYDLTKDSGEKHLLLVMLNKESGGGTHFSLRATSDRIHCGKICHTLANRLVRKYGFPNLITGGGHSRAAECKTRTAPVPTSTAILAFFRLYEQLRNLSLRADKNGLKKREKEIAIDLGLDYLK